MSRDTSAQRELGCVCESQPAARACLAAEAVEGAALALEGVDNVHGGHGLAAGVLSVSHGIADDVLEEDLEDRAGLLVDEARDTLHTTTASETADGGLGDALDVVAKDLAVALGAALAESLTALATSGHVDSGHSRASTRFDKGARGREIVKAPGKPPLQKTRPRPLPAAAENVHRF